MAVYFKEYCLIYVPPVVTLKDSAFCVRSIQMLRVITKIYQALLYQTVVNFSFVMEK
jgi:hypothetical protein